MHVGGRKEGRWFGRQADLNYCAEANSNSNSVFKKHLLPPTHYYLVAWNQLNGVKLQFVRHCSFHTCSSTLKRLQSSRKKRSKYVDHRFSATLSVTQPVLRLFWRRLSQPKDTLVEMKQYEPENGIARLHCKFAPILNTLMPVSCSTVLFCTALFVCTNAQHCIMHLLQC